jgi:NhaP-type Na+/H+ or K+/H+ antiporter
MKLFALEGYEILMLGAGIALFLSAWLPQVIVKRNVTLAVLHLLVGALIFYFLDSAAPDPLQENGRIIWEKISEFVVIISLLGAGIKLDAPLDNRHWLITGRLLLITMPLSIALGAVLGWWVLGLSPAAALLLGAVLAPTDPVLANDIQVGPPGKQNDRTRFGLTSEAGLNDGLAFPFTYLAIMFGTYGVAQGWGWLGEWAWKAVLYKITVGTLIGIGTGWGLAKVIFNYPREKPLAWEGVAGLALSILFIAYGLTENLGGYGFIGVFVAAYVFRRQEEKHHFNDILHSFTDNLERVIASLILLLMGGLTAQFIPYVNWPVVLFAVAFIALVRPLTAYISLFGLGLEGRQKRIISVYGIRGIGSIYYLAYAGGHLTFNQPDRLWATVLTVIFISAILHGLTAYPIMKRHDSEVSEVVAEGGKPATGPVKPISEPTHPLANKSEKNKNG